MGLARAMPPQGERHPTFRRKRESRKKIGITRRGEIGRRARFRFWWGNTRDGSTPFVESISCSRSLP